MSAVVQLILTFVSCQHHKKEQLLYQHREGNIYNALVAHMILFLQLTSSCYPEKLSEGNIAGSSEQHSTHQHSRRFMNSCIRALFCCG